MTVALITHASSLEHITPSGHPERVDRIYAINAAFGEIDPDKHNRFECASASLDDLKLAHDDTYCDAMKQLLEYTADSHMIDGDTHAGPGTWNAIMHGVGAAKTAVDLVFEDKAVAAFCGCRPPGHHAEPSRAMGFCFFDTAVIAARYAQKQYGIGKAVIFDFDVHHGNGTQAIVWQDKSIAYISTHEYPLFPGSGTVDEKGLHGQILNIPLPAGMDGDEYLALVRNQVIPFLKMHQPELLIFSAGFDAHKRDPLASIHLESDDFYHVTRLAVDAVRDNNNTCKVISVLEGGYDLTGLQEGLEAHLRALSE